MASNWGSGRASTYDIMDAMRAVAALAVLVAHVRHAVIVDADARLSAAWTALYVFTSLGGQAVMVFFVLSGFWITKSVISKHTHPEFFFIYFVERLTRLWIVLVPAVVLGVLLDYVGRYALDLPLYLGHYDSQLFSKDVASSLSLTTIIGNIFFLQTLFVDTVGTNDSLWSLTNEFWYYVWFPILFVVVSGRKFSWPAAAAAFAALASMFLFHKLLVGFVCWLLGAAACFASRNVSEAWRAKIAALHLTAIAGGVFAVALIVTRAPSIQGHHDLVGLTVSGAFAALLFCLVASRATAPGWLRRLSRFGAGSSYSLYAFHLPFVAFLTAVLAAPSHRLAPSAKAAAIFAAMVAVTTVYAFGMSLLTERHTKALRDYVLLVRGLKSPGSGTVTPAG